MSNHLKRVRIIGDFQFGRGAGRVLFPDGSEFLMSNTKRVRQILYNGVRIATVRASDGLLTLSIDGASCLHGFFKPPGQRVVVNEEAVPFVIRGKTAFCKHVVVVDPAVRTKDEVLVTDEKDNLLATGQAVLCADEMKDFKRGAAVMIRQGAGRFLK